MFSKCCYAKQRVLALVAEASMRDKRQKFIELAEARVGKALKDLQLIGNLCNKSAYEFTGADVRTVLQGWRQR